MPSGKKVLISNERKNGHVSCALNGLREQALMCRADSTDSPGKNLPALGYEMTQEFSVFKIDIGNFFCAKFTYSFAPNAEPSLTCHNL
jgi:hypothetical protein